MSIASMPEHQPYLNYPQAAQYLGLSVRQVERAVRSRRLSHYKLGGHQVQFTIGQLDDYRASCYRPALESP